MSSISLRPAVTVLAATGVLVGAALGVPGAATTAHADCGVGPVFALGFGKAPRLLPTLRPTEYLDCGDGREYDYTVSGHFEVADRTVARLPTFTGHADATVERLAANVKRSTRHTIRAAAKRRGARRTTLTLVYRSPRPTPSSATRPRPCGPMPRTPT